MVISATKDKTERKTETIINKKRSLMQQTLSFEVSAVKNKSQDYEKITKKVKYETNQKEFLPKEEDFLGQGICSFSKDDEIQSNKIFPRSGLASLFRNESKSGNSEKIFSFLNSLLEK